MIVCWDRCSRPTILRPHSSFAGLFARSIARSISTSTTHESDLPHETCLNPQDCRTQGALERLGGREVKTLGKFRGGGVESSVRSTSADIGLTSHFRVA